MGYVKERLGTLSTFALSCIVIACLIGSMVLGISIGTSSIDIGQIWYIVYHNIIYYLSGGTIVLDNFDDWGQGIYYDIVIQMRAPRVVMAAVVGACLAMAGVVMQASVQNPLADPYILGMASGASLGATAAIAIGVGTIFGAAFGIYGIAIVAFVGSFGSAIAVLTLASTGGRTTSVKLVLSGTIIASIMGAISNLIVVFFADMEEMQEITFWMMGSFAGASWLKIAVPLFALIVASVYFLTQIRNLNTMLTGDDVATTLGIDLSKLRRRYVCATALLTATAVCFCGVIGFVGLIIPHINRGIVGNNHWKLLPLSCLTGATFMVICDVLCRTLVPGTILPIGVITAFCGAPVFAYIMIKRTYSFGGN